MRRCLLVLLAACGGDPARMDAQSPEAASPMGTDAGSSDAMVTPKGVVFRVWAPHSTSARVEGDFDGSPAMMSPEAGGFFSTTVASAHAGTHYRFVLDNTNVRIDPLCRDVLADGSACTVVDPSAYPWKSGAFTRPPRNQTVVYEMHVGSFAPQQGAMTGTFADVRAHFSELADLGANVIELMPIQSFGGKPNAWGYNPQLFFAPKAGYGRADDLRAFVDDAHGHGMGVWIDTVINHCDGWNKAPLACFDGDCPNGSHGIYFFPPGPYATTPWGPRPNYADPQVAAMLKSTVDWWLVENRGDGFRWDSVSNIRALDGNGSVPGGKDLLVAINDRTHALGGAAIAEDLKGWDAITKSTKAGGFGFDAQWDGFGYNVTNVLAPASDDGRDMGAIQNALTATYAGDPFARLLFIEDHDTVGNGGARIPTKIDAANPTSFAARRRSMLAGVLLMTAPGVPMLFMGEESLASGSFVNPPAPLAQSIPAGFGPKMKAFYKDMIALRRNLGGLSGGLGDTDVEILQREDANKVIAYRRHGASNEDVIVVLNMRNKAYTRYDIGVANAGTWRIRLDTDWAAYGDDFAGGQTGTVATIAMAKDGKPNALPVRLGAYGAVVFTQ